MTIDASAVITGCCITAQWMVHYSTSDGKITARRMGKNSAGNAAGTYTTIILKKFQHIWYILKYIYHLR